MARLRISGRAEFEHWLDGKPEVLAVAMAGRIALRVLPLALNRSHSWSLGQSNLTLALFRAIAISRSVASVPEREISTAAATAAAAAARAADLAAAAAARAADAAACAADACAADAAVVRAAAARAAAAAAAAYAADRAAAADAPPAAVVAKIWQSIDADCAWWDEIGELPTSLMRRRLWEQGMPEAISFAWKTFVGSSQSANWEIWVDWYELLLKGGRGDWGLNGDGEREMARLLVAVGDTWWTRRPAEVNAEIEAWLRELVPRKLPRREKGADYFISYSKHDEAMAKIVAEVLDDAGHSSFAMFKDIPDGSVFYHEINRGMSGAKAFIALYSQAYFESDHCRAELAAAYARDPSGAERYARALKLEACDVPPLAANFVYRDLAGLKAADRREAILAMASVGSIWRTREQLLEEA